MNNLLKRSISGAVFGAVVIAPLAFLPSLYPAVVIVAIYMMMKEFYTVSLGGKYSFEARLAILSAVAFFSLFYVSERGELDIRWTLIALLPMIMAMVRVLFEKENSEFFYRVPYIFMGLLYIGIPTALSPVLVCRNGDFNGMLMLSFFILVWMSDIGAYFLGSVLGQREGARKLAPEISPKKSWWGVAGGVSLAIAAAALLKCLGWLDVPMVHALAIGFVVSAASVCGDLFESVWKRYFHIKDSGNAVPGHGGLLDRFDSSLMAMPAATVYMLIFNLL